MAVVALAAGGALLGGTTIGGSFGLGLGWLVGSTIGQLLFGGGEDQVNEGPRLGDLQVQSSTYGRPIPIVYGNVRVAGNVIWATDIIEVRNEETQGGGKGGGPSVTTVTYEYFGRFAIGFCEGEVEAVRKLWADGKLIMDLSSDNQGGKRWKGTLGNYRIYLGTETQDPDPLIEADKGADSVPGHRGLVYVVFDDLPLRDFGNRIPNITAEIVNSVASSYNQETGFFDATDVYPTATSSTFDINRGPLDLKEPWGLLQSGLVPSVTINGLQPFGWWKFDRFTGNFIDHINWREIWRWADEDSDGLLVDRDGWSSPIITARDDPPGLSTINSYPFFDYFRPYVYVAAEKTTNTGFFEFEILDNGRWRFTGATSQGAGPVNVVPPGLHPGAGFVWYGPPPTYSRLIVCFPSLQVNQSGGVICYRSVTDIDQPVNHNRKFELVSQETALDHCLGPAIDRANNRAWWLADNLDDVYTLNLLTGEFSGPQSFIDAVGTDDLSPPLELCYDKATGDLIFWCSAASGDSHITDAVVRVDPDSWTMTKYTLITDFTNLTDSPNGIRPPGVRVEKLHLAEVDGTVAVCANVGTGTGAWLFSTGTLLPVTDRVPDVGTTWGIASSRDPQFDPLVGCFWANDITSGRRWWFNNYTTARIELDEVVSDICQRAGLSLGDFDVTPLDGTALDGYIITKPMPARSAIEELQKAFFFDGVQEDYQIKFKFRSGNSATTVAWDDLAASEGRGDNQVRVTEPIQQEAELPRVVTVSYLNKARDYETATQQARRIADAINAKSTLPVEVPIVLTDTEGAQIADKTLNTAWRERQQIEFQVGPEYVIYSPGDVISVIKEQTDGTTATFKMRITQMDVGAGFVIQMRGVAQEAAAFDPAVVAQDTSIPAKDGIKNAVDSKPLVWNGPVIYPGAHNDGGFYLGAGLKWYTPDPAWIGAALYRATDPEDALNQLGVAGGESYRFSTQIVPPKWDPSDPWMVRDQVNTLRVRLLTPNWTPESISYATMMGDPLRNLVLLGNELIQFQTATQQADLVWDLTNFLRGRLGTEWAMWDRETGEEGWFIDPDILLRQDTVEDINETRYYAAVTIGDPVDLTPATTEFTNLSYALKPWAPADIEGAWSAGDVTITWQRRTRYGGKWKDGTGTVPLNESSEEYEIDVVDYEGNVARTVTGLTSATYTYTGANRDADFSNTGLLTPTEGEPGILINGGFETGGETGWTELDSDIDIVTSESGLGPYEGTYFCTQGFAAGDVDCEQVHVMPEYMRDYFRSGKTDLVLQYAFADWDVTLDDTFQCWLEIYDEDDNLIEQQTTGVLTADATDTWYPGEVVVKGFARDINDRVPYKVRVRFQMIRQDGNQPTIGVDGFKLFLRAENADEPATLVRVYQISQETGVDRGFAGRAVV